MKLFGHYRLDWNIRRKFSSYWSPHTGCRWYCNLTHPWGYRRIANHPVPEKATIRGWQFGIYIASLVYWPKSAAPADSKEGV